MNTIAYEHLDESAESLSVRVVERVAQRAGVDGMTLPPFYEAINPDALDALFQAERMHGQVTFTYIDYEVTIHGNGEIELDSDG